MDDVSSPRPDPGLFGPRSVTWQMHGDPMMWIAGIRALYLQALHPRAVRGVTQNSDFRRDAWGRLMRTASFVGTITYGTTDAAEQAGARVRRIHRVIEATDPDTGETYGVDEPELLLWVHCAEVDSYLQVQRRSGFPSPTPRPTGTSTNTAPAPASSASTRTGCPPPPPNSPPTSTAYAPTSPPEPRPPTSTTSSAVRPCVPGSFRRAPWCGGG